MLKKSYFLVICFGLLLPVGAAAQKSSDPPPPPPRPATQPSQPATSGVEYPRQILEVSREDREQAYAKLLEGQRHFWKLGNSENRDEMIAGSRLAREALMKAVQLDPSLAEAYTALAELTYKYPPNDPDEAIRLASIAIKVSPDNFGGHQTLARLNTFKSRLNRTNLDEEFIAKAVVEWKEVVRLDPRNAEAFAFLSAIYDQTGRPTERIGALKSWVSAAVPIDGRFYSGIMRMGDLSIENAVLRLGEALFKEGEIVESVLLLSRAVGDSPDNSEAIELLSRAIEASDTKAATGAIESLQQAVFANSANTNLIVLLAQVQARAGRFDDSVSGLRRTILELTPVDKNAAANLQIALGDIYSEFDRFAEAASVYKNALTIRGIESGATAGEEDSEFTSLVFEKTINALKHAERPGEVKKVIEEARVMLGGDDAFADRQLISFYRETGKSTEALQAVRNVRLKSPDDYGLMRLEAGILTEAGRVDEGVKLIKSLIGGKPADTSSPGFSLKFDDFTNYIFISGLFSQAKRGKDAIDAANQALALARSEERKQIARITLATALNMSGNFAGAESTLREILAQTPGNPIALNNLGYFLVERNEKVEEALKLIQKAVDIDPANASYLDSLGWAYFRLGKLPEAVRYLTSAARIDPSSATIQEHLGDVFQKQNETDLAKSAWEKSLRLSTDNAQISRLKTKLKRK